jgi:hypothetical protein
MPVMTSLRTSPALWLLAAAAVLAPRAALAQEDAAIAEQLFRDGRALMQEGKIDEACEKFASSQRLAPAVGTKLNLAICREKQGKTATAWSLFADVEAVAQRNGDAARARIAHDHEAALTGQLKKVVIEVPSPPPGMVVKLDGTPLPVGALGTEIPLDPGDHDVTVTAPGKKTWEEAKLNLGPSATTVHVRVELQDEAPPAPAQPVAAPPTAMNATPAAEPAAPSGPDVAEAPAAPPRTNTKLIAGLVVGGAGVVALGVAGYYGLTAIGRKNDENNYPVGSQDRLTVYDQAKTAQTWGFVFGGAGVAALGVGLYLVLTSHAQPDTATTTTTGWRVVPALGPSLSGASLQATF